MYILPEIVVKKVTLLNIDWGSIFRNGIPFIKPLDPPKITPRTPIKNKFIIKLLTNQSEYLQ